jgi:hypothetical protein
MDNWNGSGKFCSKNEFVQLCENHMWILCENVKQDAKFEEYEILKKMIVCLFFWVS